MGAPPNCRCQKERVHLHLTAPLHPQLISLRSRALPRSSPRCRQTVLHRTSMQLSPMLAAVNQAAT